MFGSIPEEGEFVGGKAETALGTRYGKTISRIARKSIIGDEIFFSFRCSITLSQISAGRYTFILDQISHPILSTSMY